MTCVLGDPVSQVLDRLNPAVIFSAHDHHGYLFTGDRQTGRLERWLTPLDTGTDAHPAGT